MEKLRKGVSVLLIFIFTTFVLMSNLNVQALSKVSAVPRIAVSGLKSTYEIGNKVKINISTPSYKSGIRYKVLLNDTKTKKDTDISKKLIKTKSIYNSYNLELDTKAEGTFVLKVYGKLSNSKKQYDCTIQKSFKVIAKSLTINKGLLEKKGTVYSPAVNSKLKDYPGDLTITSEKITLMNSMVEGNLYVNSNNDTLSNLKVKGTIFVNPGKSGVAYINNVVADRINVLSGGENSIHLKNVSANNLYVDSSTNVRVESSGETEIDNTVISSSAIIDTKGGNLGTISVSKGDSLNPEVEFRGTYDNEILIGAQATIKTGDNSSISKLEISPDSSSEKVTLQGTFNTVEVEKDSSLVLDAKTEIKDSIKLLASAEVKADTSANVNKVEIAPEDKTSTINLEGTFNTVEVNKQSKLQIGADTEIKDSIKLTASADVEADKTSSIARLQIVAADNNSNVKLNANTIGIIYVNSAVKVTLPENAKANIIVGASGAEINAAKGSEVIIDDRSKNISLTGEGKDAILKTDLTGLEKNIENQVAAQMTLEKAGSDLEKQDAEKKIADAEAAVEKAIADAKAAAELKAAQDKAALEKALADAKAAEEKAAAEKDAAEKAAQQTQVTTTPVLPPPPPPAPVVITPPVVSSGTVIAIDKTSAAVGGNIVSTGNGTITSHGIVWSDTTTNPAIDLSTKVVLGSASTGVFTATMTGLTSYTTYYIKAFAANSAGTSYSTAITYIAPDETTSGAINVSPLSAYVGEPKDITLTYTLGSAYTNGKVRFTLPAGITATTTDTVSIAGATARMLNSGEISNAGQTVTIDVASGNINDPVALVLKAKIISAASTKSFSASGDADGAGNASVYSMGTGSELATYTINAPVATTAGTLVISPANAYQGETKTVTLTYTLGETYTNGRVVFTLPTGITATTSDTVNIAGAGATALTSGEISGQTVTIDTVSGTGTDTVVLTLTGKTVSAAQTLSFSAKGDADGTIGFAKTLSAGTGSEATNYIVNPPATTTAGTLVISPTNAYQGETKTITLTYTLGETYTNGSVVFTLPTGITATTSDTVNIAGVGARTLTSGEISGQTVAIDTVNGTGTDAVVLTLTGKTVSAAQTLSFSAKGDADGTTGFAKTLSAGTGSEETTYTVNPPGTTLSGTLTVSPTSAYQGETKIITLTYTLGETYTNGSVVFTLPTGITAATSDTVNTAGAGATALTSGEISGQTVTIDTVSGTNTDTVVLILTGKTVPSAQTLSFCAKGDADGTTGLAKILSAGTGSEAKTFTSNPPGTTLSGTLAVSPTSAYQGETKDITLTYTLGETYTNGSVVFTLPTGITAATSDTVNIAGAEATALTSGEISGQTVTIDTVNGTGTVVLTLTGKTVPSAQTLSFSAKGDADGTTGLAKILSAGTGSEATTYTVNPPGTTLSGTLAVSPTSAYQGETKDITLTYTLGETYTNGSVVFTLPTGITAATSDTVNIAGAGATALTSGEISGQTVTIDTVNGTGTVVLTLTGKTVPSAQTLSFSAKGDADGNGFAKGLSAGTGSEATTFASNPPGATLSGTLAVSPTSAYEGETKDIALTYTLGETYTNGNVVFTLPTGITATTSDTVNIAGAGATALTSGEISGQTVTIDTVNGTGTVVLTLTGKIIPAAQILSFNAKGDADGNGFAKGLSAGTGSEATTFTSNQLVAPNFTTDPGDGQITLTWNAVAGAVDYKIFQGNGVTYTNVDTTTNTSYTATGLNIGETYWFYVTAENAVHSVDSNPVGELTNIDINGDTYKGNVLLVDNVSIDSNTTESSGTLPQNITRASLDMATPGLGYKAYRVNPLRRVQVTSGTQQNIMQSRASVLKSYNLNDTRTFWVSNIQTNTDYQIDATLVYIGTYSEVWVNAGKITQAQAQQLATEFDTNIYPMETSKFGMPTDVDGNGKVDILVYDIQDGFSGSGGFVAGYFYQGDILPASANNPDPNGMEVFNVDTYPTMGIDQANPDVTGAYSTLAHEFQHMIDFGQRYVLNQKMPLDTWIDEGLSMAAEQEYSGYQTDRIDYYNTSASIREGHSLLYWDNAGDVLSNYSLSYLFFQYLREQCPGVNVYQEIINSPYDDYRAVEQVIQNHISPSITFDSFLHTFRIALMVKAQNGLYGFRGDPGFSGINTQLYTGSTTTLRGGGAIYKSITQDFNDPHDSDPDIWYTGIIKP